MVQLGNVAQETPTEMGIYPKSCWELCFSFATYFQGKKTQTFKNCLRSLGDICQLLGKVQFGGAGPAEITVKDKLHQETLPWSFTLWHCTCLWWVPCLKNLAWPKQESGVLVVSSKYVFEDSEAKMEIPACVPPVVCWENGWRDKERLGNVKHHPFVLLGFGEVRKGRGQEESTGISINSVIFIECKGHSLVWGNVVLLDYNIWLACRAGTDRTTTAMKIFLTGWKRVTCFDIMTFLSYYHTWVRICDFLIPPT